MTSAVERHAILVEHGWSVRLDGKWRPPDPTDLRVFTFAAAWHAHVEPHDPTGGGGDTLA